MSDQVTLGKYQSVRIPYEPWKEAVVQNIIRHQMSYEEAEKRAKEDLAAKKIAAYSQIRLSEEEVVKRARQMMEAYALRLQQQGLSIEGYYRVRKTNAQELLDQMKEKAREQIRSRMVLAAVAKAEKLEATEEEYEQELRRLSARYMMEKDRVRAILRGEEETRIRQDIAVAKAAEYVAQNVRIDS